MHNQQFDRRSVRLRGYDYRDGGMYFITLCTKNRECIFGEIRNGIMGLSGVGCVVANCWQQIPNHFPGVQLDQWIVMPNHMHGLLWMDDPKFRGITGVACCTGLACQAPTRPPISASRQTPTTPQTPSTIIHTPECIDRPHVRAFANPERGSLGTIIGAFKSASTRRINILCNEPGAVIWQRNFHEHIVRNEHETFRIRRYIMDNPSRWNIDDEYHP